MQQDSTPPSEPQDTSPSPFGPDVSKSLTPVAAILPAAPASTGVAIVPLSERVGGELTPGQKDVLDRYFKKAISGMEAMSPMICRGQACVIYNSCPLREAGLNLPEGKQCPVEDSILVATRAKIIAGCGIPEEHEKRDLALMMVDEIMLTVMKQLRVAWYSSQNPEVMKETVIGVSQDGSPIYSEQLDPTMDWLLRASGAKIKMLRELLATPRAEVEARRKMGMDPSTAASAALAKINQLRAGGSVEASYIRIDLDD